MKKFINDLEKNGFVKKEKIGFDQIIKHIERAVLDLRAAEANLEIDFVVSYNCSYSAMLKAGRALMFLFSYRPSDGQQHKTVVLFSEKALGIEFFNLVNKFDKMRVLRNKFTYDEPEIQVSESQAKDALVGAKAFVLKISNFIETKNPQIKLIKNT
jgi:uncharacterized protein (UPF0332 family)